MKTIPFIVLMLLTGYGATAQDNPKLYLLQYNHYYFTAKTYDNQQVMETRQKAFPIGLQVVTFKGKIRAQRIGVTFAENQLLSPIQETISSASINHFKSYKVFAPTFTFGQEWQYQVFRPLVLYIGAELGFGLMRNSFKSHEEIAGLGYYSRARNLHACAVAVLREHGGVFPDTEESLRRLPGIGPYTASAIAAIAFDRRTMPVDGNIERVVARLFAIETPLPAAKP